MSPSVTLKDIARAAGVSTAAISQALNDRGSMRPETRERIKTLAAELGYVPNRHATALRSGRTMTVGFVMGDDPEPDRRIPDRRIEVQRTRKLTSLVRAAAEHGFTVTVLPQSNPGLIAGTTLDALYVPDARGSQQLLQAAIARGIPIVADDQFVDGSRGLSIRTGYDTAVRAGLDVLERSGAQRIAYLTDEPAAGGSSPRDEIGRAAYEIWSSVRGRESVVRTIDPARRTLPRVLTEVLAGGADAVFAGAEDGPDVYLQLEEMRLVIPRDVQLVALCTSDCAVNRRLGVTHVCIRPDLAADVMFETLPAALLSDGPRVVDLPWELVTGATTRPSLAAVGQSAKAP
ncbi:LacI family transcriptional regulator [Microbacterium sp. EYE_5]|uniref:LacI family DNA-binding transcriptional regulator n=1 Tax=unclassified Microbacterium TaxID=2609290 RepID=UPI0020041D82|nr:MULTISPECIES: LacI family DNA-binding transcriptional regulator [unclassified Microbacterium]MCK6081155.1 LacI family transcriptional regulator [Microbacterium sp. EYE_382]MCK6086425.1 LacI family transcriptional regulator [Microbacterium sp. EYE_384]MCK6124077.1 LacI family transcriptional regulator [Microbacterium sp. EYE_80]MCK6126986.1 LacI family transcriptional regulator [Microbacterium sp. EYE_79]MCK6142110.1 LacI family transcriptional regulator [Microbacterium sp. EYE_39]